MTSQISHAIKHRSEPKDVFYTPESAVKKHIEQIDVVEGEKWFDPFFGKGAYYNAFPATVAKDFTEIAMDKDFFAYSEPVDVIVSNPPYSCIDKVLEKSVSLNPRVISYLLGHGALTPRRLEFMKSKGYTLTGLYICKVFKWYGMSEAVTFTRGAPEGQTKVVWDRIVHK